jgi:hypothetical protein
MTDEPEAPESVPNPEIGNAASEPPKPQRVRKGWEKGKKRGPRKKPEPQEVVHGPHPSPLQMPVSSTMPGITGLRYVDSPPLQPAREPLKAEPLPKPPYSPGGRHRLRSAEEYPAEEITSTRHHIPRDRFPQGYDLQWIGISVWGQPLPMIEAEFRRMGWEAVYPEDFDRVFAYLVPPNWEGPIIVDALALVARSMAWSNRARQIGRREAEQAVNIKVNQLRKGELEGVSLGPQHKHLEKTNQVNVSLDQIPGGGRIED